MTTKEEVIRLVRSTADKGEGYQVVGSSIVLDVGEMKRLIELVKTEENEACAKTCEDRAGTMSMFATTRDAKTHNAAVKGDAAAIRARRK